LIGNVYVFGDSLASMLDTVRDEAPILNSKGESKGVMVYSVIPKMFDDRGHEM